MKRLKSVLVLLMFAVISLMLGITSTAAFADERGDQENRQKNSRVEQRGGGQQKQNVRVEQRGGGQPERNVKVEKRGWDQREHIDYQGAKYDYHEGRFYRPGLFGFILDAILPPRGIVVTYLPVGHRTVIVGRTTYYEFENIYYQPSPGGYVVVQAPIIANQYVPAPVVYVPPPNIAVPFAQPQPVEMGTVIVNVPTATRGPVAITLMRYSNGFVGPQGELYPAFPSTEELSARYGQ